MPAHTMLNHGEECWPNLTNLPRHRHMLITCCPSGGLTGVLNAAPVAGRISAACVHYITAKLIVAGNRLAPFPTANPTFPAFKSLSICGLWYFQAYAQSFILDP